MNLATDYRFFDAPGPVFPFEIQLFQQFLSPAVRNGRRPQPADTLEGFLKRPYINIIYECAI